MNLDASVLRELKRRARDEGKSLGDVISELVAPVLSRGMEPQRPARLRWKTARMGPAKMDLEDKEAVREALDRQ